MQAGEYHGGNRSRNLSDKISSISEQVITHSEKDLPQKESAKADISSPDDIKVIDGKQYNSIKDEEGEAVCLDYACKCPPPAIPEKIF